MRTWNDYKQHVKTVDPLMKKEIEETEEIAAIITTMIEQRKALGLTQRDLASLCNIPQSSVARIESCKSTPKLSTLLNIFQQLGLSLTVTKSEPTSYFSSKDGSAAFDL